MKIPGILMVTILALAGCGGQESADQLSPRESQMSMMDEITPIDELPSFLKEGLSAEEQEELKKKIMPTLDDGLTPEERFKNLLRDADAGDPDAQNGLGAMYYTGEAVSRDAAGNIMDYDPVSAAGWFFRAAEQGHAEAQFNLALLYLNGEGVDQDATKALEWFTRSAEQGNTDAQNNLGVIYSAGEGVEQDIEEATKWFEKAAAQGNEEAKENLEVIRSEHSEKN
jgi:uncharacterized protein